MHIFRILVLALTAAMLLLHIGTASLLGRARAHKRGGFAPAVGVVLRLEAAYYALLLVYVAVSHQLSLLVPATVLAAIHMAGLALFAGRPAPAAQRLSGSPVVITGVRLFDAAEALALAWIAWLLAR